MQGVKNEDTDWRRENKKRGENPEGREEGDFLSKKAGDYISVRIG